MKFRKTNINSLLGFVFIIASLYGFSPIASAATWTLGQGEGACYKGDKRKGGAKYCHNCKAQSGNKVVWTFEAKCDGVIAGSVGASLACGSSTPSEGSQLRSLQASAEQSLPPSTQACP